MQRVRNPIGPFRCRVYANLYREAQPTGINQVWVADLTYVRLLWDFVYLAVILDAFSRRVVGWALSRSLEASLTVAALRAALEDRQPAPGCLHHSERGVQYACDEYVKLLEEAGMQINMSRRGNPYDNAQAESFLKTLGAETAGVPGTTEKGAAAVLSFLRGLGVDTAGLRLQDGSGLSHESRLTASALAAVLMDIGGSLLGIANSNPQNVLSILSMSGVKL